MNRDTDRELGHKLYIIEDMNTRDGMYATQSMIETLHKLELIYGYGKETSGNTAILFTIDRE